MKIIARYLVKLPYWVGGSGDERIYEVIELMNGNFYRLNHHLQSGEFYVQVDKEVMYEAIANSML